MGRRGRPGAGAEDGLRHDRRRAFQVRRNRTASRRAKVRADRLALKNATAKLDVIITSSTIAHRARKSPVATTVTGVESIFDLIENLLKKYLGLLKGVVLANGVEPTPQFDTEAPFMFPWHPAAYAEWKRHKTAGAPLADVPNDDAPNLRARGEIVPKGGLPGRIRPSR